MTYYRYTILVSGILHIYPKEHEIKETTYALKSDSNLDLHLEIDGIGKIFTKLHDKRYDFSFRIVNFPFICGYILTAPAYGVLIRYTRACHNYADFLCRAKLVEISLLEQINVATSLRSLLQKFMVVIVIRVLWT